HPLLDAPADHVEVALEPLGGVPPRVGDHDLLDLGARRVRLLADHADIHGHLAPAVDRIAGVQYLGLDDGPTPLLAIEIGARQEDHADCELPGPGLVARVLDVLAEEVLRDLHMDAGAVAGFAIGIDG